MKKALRRSALRDIKKSLGRFIAITAIVALGVGFFAGLKVTTSAMIKTANDYFDDSLFYDIRLISTYGFTESDVDAAKALDFIETVSPSYSADALVESESGLIAMRFHALSKIMNTPTLIEGRLPQSTDECVVDSGFLRTGVWPVGSKVMISSSNNEDSLGSFSSQEFTVVGIVDSPEYINFQRGNTSLGDGSISGYVYLLPEAFDSEFYTELYVRVADSSGLKAYSDEYEDLIKQASQKLETFADKRIKIRYDDIVSEAEAEIADAKAELADKRTEADAEFAKAENEIKNSEKQIADAKAELTDKRAFADTEFIKAENEIKDSEKQIADAKAELAEKRAAADAEFASAETEIALNEEKLSAARKEYDVNAIALASSEKLLEETYAQISAGCQEIAAAEDELKNAAAAAEQVFSQYEQQLLSMRSQSEQLYASGQTEAAAAIDALANELEAKIADERSDASLKFDAARAEIDSKISELDNAQSAADRSYNELKAGKDELAAVDAALSAAEDELKNGKTELAEQRAVAQLQFSAAEKKISEAEVELAKGKAKLTEKRAEAQIRFADAEKEISDAEAELAKGKDQFAQTRLDAETEIADAEAEISEAETKISDLKMPEWFVLDRFSNIGYSSFDNDSNIIDAIAAVFPAFFFLVAALVCLTTMTRMVEEQRTQIGVLKALGYSKGSIAAKYIFYSASAAVLGCVVGLGCGFIVFPKTIWAAYGIMYTLPPIAYLFDISLALMTSCAAIICCVGATIFACYYVLNSVPAELIRPKSPPMGKRVLLERVRFIWNRMKFIQKVSVRNLFRYKKRFFMMVLGIGGCTALLFTGLGLRDSIIPIVDLQYDEIFKYDVKATLFDPADASTGDHFSELLAQYAEKITVCADESVDVSVGDKTVSTTLISAADPEEFSELTVLRSAGDIIPYPEAGSGSVILTEKIAEKLGVDIGDSVEIRNSSLASATFTVAGIVENYVYSYIYVNSADHSEKFGSDPVFKSIIVKAKDGLAGAAGAVLLGDEKIASTNINSDLRAIFRDAIKSLNIVVMLIIGCAAALAFIVLYNLTNINITERMREIATLKVLGFYDGETSAYVYRENVVLTAIGAAAGIIGGIFLHRFVISSIDIQVVSFKMQAESFSYVLSVVLTFLFAAFVNIIMHFKLKHIDMAESLKSIE